MLCYLCEHLKLNGLLQLHAHITVSSCLQLCETKCNIQLPANPISAYTTMS